MSNILENARQRVRVLISQKIAYLQICASYAMSSDSDIDSPSCEIFRREEWIGTGRRLPTDPNSIPTGLAKLFEMLLRVPSAVKALQYPPADLDIKQFLAFAIPEQTHALPKIPVGSCFSHSIPNESEETLCSRPLPPRHFIEKLYDQFRQAILDGMTALEDPVFPGSYLPFWCIQFWKDMWVIHDAQGEWKEAIVWLDELSNSEGSKKDLFICARRSLETLRWNEDTGIPGANRTTTLEFASYLSHNKMMKTIHLDMMFTFVSELAGDVEEEKAHVETMRFWREIDMLKSKEDLDKPSHAFPQLKCFDMIPSNHFLCALKHVPQASETGLRISTGDFDMFKLLKAKLPSITRAISDLRKKSTSESTEVEFEDE